MKCEICHKRNAATVIHRKDDKGEDRELYVCKACAEEEKKPHPAPGDDPEVSAVAIGPDGKPIEAPPFLKNLVRATLGLVGSIVHEESKRAEKCPKCGRTWHEIKADLAPFGCPECYNAFRAQIREEMLCDQYGRKHAGGMPPTVRGEATRDYLMRELKKAVAAEDFAKAKKLQERLNELGDSPEKDAK